MGDTKDKKPVAAADPRRDYVIGYFGKHTHHKIYENYVVTGIWHRLRAQGLLLKPVTQQFVSRPNRKYALIDLYFPAVNVAVECDEGQHFDRDGLYVPKDIEREYDVLKILAAFPLKPKSIRIKAVSSLAEIDSQLDAAAKKIAGLARRKSPEALWPEDVSAKELLKKNGKITIADPVLFRVVDDIVNAFEFKTQAGKPYHKSQLSKRFINDSECLWFPHLTWKESSNRYTNVWDEKNGEIREYNTGDKKNNWADLIRRDRFFRYTFCHIKDPLGKLGLKFYGKFELDKHIYKDKNGHAYLIWKKVGDEIGIDLKDHEAGAPKPRAARLPKSDAPAAGPAPAWDELCRKLTAKGWKARSNVLYRVWDDCPYLAFKILNAGGSRGRLEFGVLSEFAAAGEKADWRRVVGELKNRLREHIEENVLTVGIGGGKFGVAVDTGKNYFVLKPTENRRNAGIPFGNMEDAVSEFARRLRDSGAVEILEDTCSGATR